MPKVIVRLVVKQRGRGCFAAPMVGGLISSTFLTLEIIPVVYTYWRLWQIKHEKKESPAAAEQSSL